MCFVYHTFKLYTVAVSRGRLVSMSGLAGADGGCGQWALRNLWAAVDGGLWRDHLVCRADCFAQVIHLRESDAIIDYFMYPDPSPTH